MKPSLIFILFFNMIYFTTCYSKSTISVVTGNDYGPFCDENLSDGGLFTHLVKNILTKMNTPYEIQFLPWARGYEVVKKGKVSLTFPYIKTLERENDVIYASESLINTNLYLVSELKPENNNKLTLNDFKNQTFCNPVGYAQEKTITNQIAQNKIKVITEFDSISCLKSIMLGKADVMTLNENYIKLLKVQENAIYKNLNKINQPIAQNELYVIFSKNTDLNFIKKFNDVEHEFILSDEYKKIIKETQN